MANKQELHKAATKLLDFIIIFSIVSAFVFWFFIEKGLVTEVNVRWIFLPGYSLMLITLILARLALIGTKGGPDQ